MIRVGILGATGYCGQEAIERLLVHPEVQITALTCRNPSGQMIGDIFPRLIRQIRHAVEEGTPDQLAKKCDLVFSCLPHRTAQCQVSALIEHGCRVIDLSPDYRLSSNSIYERWFGEKHPDPARLESTPYGLQELFDDNLSSVQLVANPGAVPTAALLPLAPLIKEGLVDESDVIVDCKSGMTTEGRICRQELLYAEVAGGVAAHSIGNSRHQPEIIDVVQRFSGKEIGLSFVPHLVPMERGTLATLHLKPSSNASPNQLRECLISYYHHSPFVRVISHMPSTRYVERTNFVDISVRENGSRVTIICALDNLGKGSVGTAIQNMNRMFQLPATTGFNS